MSFVLFMRGKHSKFTRQFYNCNRSLYCMCFLQCRVTRLNAIETSLLSAEDTVSLGIFCTKLCIPPFSPNHPSPTKALFFRRIKAQIIVSVPRAECRFYLLCEEHWHSWDANSWIRAFPLIEQVCSLSALKQFSTSHKPAYQNKMKI